MNIKIILTIGDTSRTILEDGGRQCVENWDEIKCAYSRDGFTGVTRSFTSAFKFTGVAYEALLDEYLAHRHQGDATLAIYGQNNNLGYDLLFSCPLDFSTVQISRKTIAINAIDESAAAAIKTNKGTDYEFKIGEDIQPDGVFRFDRIPITESVTYELTDGESQDDGSLDITFNATTARRIWAGSTADEVSVGGVMYWLDDQEEDDDSYCLKACQDAEVTVYSKLACANYVHPAGNKTGGYWKMGDVTDYNLAYNLFFSAVVIDPNGNARGSGASCGSIGPTYCHVGIFTKLDELRGAWPEDTSAHAGDLIAEVDGDVYEYAYSGTHAFWRSTGKTIDDYSTITRETTATVTMQKGDRLLLLASGTVNACNVKSSKFQFSWTAIGNTCEMDCFKPITLLQAVCFKVFDQSVNVVPSISDHDPRLADTVMIAAESARGIDPATVTLSFSKFCDWLETVFGYTYRLGDITKSTIADTTPLEFARFGSVDYPESGKSDTATDPAKIVYNSIARRFYLDDNGHYYTWDGYQEYTDTTNGHPRADRLYLCGGIHYRYDNGQMIVYPYDPSNATRDFQPLEFVHRSEIFAATTPATTITDAQEGQQSVDSSSLYATVEIGYDDQDYDSVNGRDEFNFANTYTTGLAVTDKRLQLLSKFRADCYGLEFAAQKRGEDTSDTDTDTDVFFVLCDTAEDGARVPDRSLKIQGALNDKVFNGAFSPMACLRANEGYIGAQADTLKLAFASSTGNSDIIIDDTGMSDDIELSAPLFRADVFSFTTANIDTPEDMDCLVAVEYDGIRYTGYISSLELVYQREEAAEYELIVKSIELC